MIELRRRYSGGAQSPSFSRLPKEYQEVEYIKNISRSYIKLPIKQYVNSFYRIDVTLMHETNEEAYDAICGYFTYQESGDYFDLGVINDGLRFRFAQSTVFSSINISKHVKHRINVNNTSGTYLDDNLINNSTSVNTWEYDGHMGVFARYDYSHQRPDYFFLGRIYDFEMYENENKIINLIPCYRISDRVAGMYDIVNDLFYVNSGEGEFIIGPDVHYNIPPEYQEVEYLESTGTQYIELPVKISDNPIIRMRMEWTNAAGGGSLGYQINGWQNGPQIGCFAKGGTLVWCNFEESTSAVRFREIYNVELDASTVPSILKVDGINLYNNNRINDYNMKLFACSNATNNSPFLFSHERIYYAEILCEQLHIKIYPCYRKKDNTAGMYDIVNGVFYTNAGTGSFIVGPDVI